MTTERNVERFLAMGTRIELHVFGAGDRDALAQARRAIEEVDDALTIHRPSPTVAVNEALLAGQGATIDSPVLLDALVEIQTLHWETLGLFDPAADLRLGMDGWNAISFDRASARISASRPVALDFGGFGKGFALDRACRPLREAGVSSALLSAGESSIAVVGAHPLGGGWPFAIPDPASPGRVLVEVEIEDESLSISSTVGAGVGSPERAALLRPGGVAIDAPRCAVVIESSGARAEAFSTALIVADTARRISLRESAEQRRFLFDLVGEARPLKVAA